jgi:hypothetical protein
MLRKLQLVRSESPSFPFPNMLAPLLTCALLSTADLARPSPGLIGRLSRRAHQSSSQDTLEWPFSCCHQQISFRLSSSLYKTFVGGLRTALAAAGSILTISLATASARRRHGSCRRRV